MKLKHVLFSSLLLSTGFVACTNEDITEISAPVNTSEGISLGEGYTIVGGKATDATSRAYVKDDLSASLWETTDKIGAAWYDMVTAIDEEGNVTAHSSFNSNKIFASNIWFKWSKQVGSDMSLAEFTSEANAMAGAYVLYYPYDETLTTSFAGIPVKVPYSQTMDCTAGKELDGINDNLFAYTVYPFVPGGTQTAEFKMNQLPNIFKLQFQVKKPELMSLESPVKITKVIVEAVDANGSVLYEEGTIAPAKVTDYKTLAGLGEAKYAKNDEKGVSNLILDVKNAGSDYTISKLETPTVKPFYIAALPFSNSATTVTIKILTEDGKVYKKAYTSGDAFNYINTQATEQGKLISLTVTLENLEDEGTIYTADQFKTKWNDALKLGADKTITLNIGDGVDLSDVDLDLNANTNIVLVGKSLKVKSLDVTNGSLKINNELTVAGDVTIGSNAKGFTTTDGVLSVEGNLNVAGTAQNVKVAKLEGLDVDASGVISIEGVKNTKDESIVELGTVNNEGALTLKSIKVKDLTNTNSVEIADANVSNEGTITNNGTFTLSADFANNGTFNQNKTINGTSTFNNNPGATLNVNANTTAKIVNDAADASKGKAAAVININGTSSTKTTLTAANASDITNKGTIKVNAYGVLTENGTADALVQDDDAARIYVADNGTIELEGTTDINNGYIVATKAATVNANGSTSKIASEVTATTTTNVNAKATVYFMNGDFTNTQITATLNNVNKTLYFTGGTITLAANLTLKGNVTFAGNVAIKAASTVAAESTVTLTFTNGKTNTVVAGATLDVTDTKVKLDGSAANTKLTVEANAQVKRHDQVVGSNFQFTFE